MAKGKKEVGSLDRLHAQLALAKESGDTRLAKLIEKVIKSIESTSKSKASSPKS